MSGSAKLLTAGGGGVSLTPASSIASDVTVNVPITGVNNGTLVCSDSSGNVGIGTSSPIDKLHVAGGMTSTSIAAPSNIGIGSVQLGYDGTNGVLRTWNSSPMRFDTAGSERMRIDSSGSVGIGGTPSGTKFLVQSSAQENTCYFAQSRSDYYSTMLRLLCNTAPGDGTSFNAMDYYNGNLAASMFRIQGNGNVKNYNNSYGALSDLKLKENVVDATPKLDNLMKVRVVNYNLIGDAHKQIGVVAQELEKVFPGLVDETPDFDEEGQSLGTATKGVKYSVFVPMLIKAIQELKVEVDDFKTQLEAK